MELGKLPFEGYPVSLLTVCFLYRDNVVVVDELSNSTVLGFPSILGKTLGGEEAVGVPGGK